MKSVNMKEQIRVSFIYTAAAAFSPIIQVIVQPIYEGTGRLNAVDFSHLAITELFTSLVFAFTLFGMSNAIARFYYDVEQDSLAYKKMISGIFSSIVFRGLLVLLIVILFRNQIGKLFHQPELQDFGSYGYACLITGIGRAVNVTAAALFRNEKKILYFVLVSMGLGLFRTGFQLFGLFYLDMSFLGYINGSAIGTGFVTLLILIYVFYKAGFSRDIKMMREINKFATPLTQYSIIVWVLTYADKYLLEQFPSELGIYNTAVTFGVGIAIILQGLQGANQPEVFRVMKDGINENQHQIRQLANALLMQSIFIIVVAILPTMLYLTYLYETQVQLAANLVALVFLRSILRTQFIVFSYPSYYLKRTKILLYLNLVGVVVNIGLNFLLIPLYMFYGAIAAGLIADLLMVLGMYFYQKRIVNIEWSKEKLLYFPISIIFITVATDLIRARLVLSPFITAGVVTVFTFSGILFLYRSELRLMTNKILKR